MSLARTISTAFDGMMQAVCRELATFHSAICISAIWPPMVMWRSSEYQTSMMLTTSSLEAKWYSSVGLKRSSRSVATSSSARAFLHLLTRRAMWPAERRCETVMGQK